MPVLKKANYEAKRLKKLLEHLYSKLDSLDSNNNKEKLRNKTD